MSNELTEIVEKWETTREETPTCVQVTGSFYFIGVLAVLRLKFKGDDRVDGLHSANEVFGDSLINDSLYQTGDRNRSVKYFEDPVLYSPLLSIRVSLPTPREFVFSDSPSKERHCMSWCTVVVVNLFKQKRSQGRN